MDLIRSTFQKWSDELLDEGVILSFPRGEQLWDEYKKLPQSANLRDEECPFDIYALQIWVTIYLIGQVRRQKARKMAVSPHVELAVGEAGPGAPTP